MNATNRTFVGLIALHLLFLFPSIFYVYFTSAVIPHVSIIQPDTEASAKRLIFIVADGLRDRSLLQNDMKDKAPFLHSMINTKAVYALSKTHIPTETRPGHVALFAGFYEDVSAIMTGWKENIVEFDTVFNHSTHSWLFGSGDIVPVFAKGVNSSKIESFYYDNSLEDYAAEKTWELDEWVFTRIQKFFKERASETVVQRSGVVIFLHLLGLDVSGHSHKPTSRNFFYNLKVVDSGVEEVYAAARKVFHDNEDNDTLYVLTTDHGMTDWGSHGSGSDDETNVPFIAWGAGIRYKRFEVNKRIVMEQADICPLISLLLGHPIPKNSVGKLPWRLLDRTPEDIFLMLRTNTRQILEQFKAKRKDIFDTRFSFLFQEISGLALPEISEELRLIEAMHRAGSNNAAFERYETLMDRLLYGIAYYHNYNRFSLGFCIAVTFLSSIFLSFEYLLQEIESSWKEGNTDLPSNDYSKWNSPLFKVVILIAVIWLSLQSMPKWHWVFYVIAATVSCRVLRSGRLSLILQCLYREWVNCLFTICVVCLMYLGFSKPFYFCVALLLFGSRKIWTEGSRQLSWVLLSLPVCLLPYFQVIGLQPNIMHITMVGICIVTYMTYSLVKIRRIIPRGAVYVLGSLTAMHLLTVLIVIYVRWSNLHNVPTVGIVHAVVWCILILSLILPFLSYMNGRLRYLALNVGCLSVYSMLTLSHEIWCVLLIAVMVFHESELILGKSLIVHSSAQFKRIGRTFQFKEVLEPCLSHIFYLYFAFFATGNFASINSFDPRSTYCFVTTFKPFVMGGLLLLKIVLPMMILSGAFYLITKSMELPLSQQFYMLLALSDCFALLFFFSIKDSGSWQDIGISISHYVIAMATGIIALALNIAMSYLMDASTLLTNKSDMFSLTSTFHIKIM